jgi:hypothetical protein
MNEVIYGLNRAAKTTTITAYKFNFEMQSTNIYLRFVQFFILSENAEHIVHDFA